MNAGKEKINHFRARIDLALREKGWSLSELGRKIGKSPQNIHDLVERGNPRASVLKEIADALGMDPGDLLADVTPDEYGEAFMPTLRG